MMNLNYKITLRHVLLDFLCDVLLLSLLAIITTHILLDLFSLIFTVFIMLLIILKWPLKVFNLKKLSEEEK